jgi:hypothetical protein
LRKQFLKDRTQLEALLDLVSSGEYEHKVWVKEGMVIGLFLIYKPAIELVRRFKAVFLMDCTYQTNILQMPLLNIVGITSTYQTFNASFALLPDELESSYVWALSQFRSIVVPAAIATDREIALMNAIKHVFPQCANILCIWHINKNVLKEEKNHISNTLREISTGFAVRQVIMQEHVVRRITLPTIFKNKEIHGIKYE